MSMSKPVRRVVTGEDSAGRSRVVSDGPVDPTTAALLPGAAFHRLWGTDVPIHLPSDGHPAAVTQWFAPAGGFRFAFCTLPPVDAATHRELDPTAAVAEMRQNLPGMLVTFQP